MFHGSHGPFRWIESSSHQLKEVLHLCPELVLHRHLVITAFDSGKMERIAGDSLRHWRVGSALYLPPAESIQELPQEVFSEWYTFSAPPPEQKLESFVNYGWFSLGPSLGGSGQPGTRWDLKRLQRIFWQQLESILPESYLAGGSSRMIFATQDQVSFTAVLHGLCTPLKARAAGAQSAAS